MLDDPGLTQGQRRQLQAISRHSKNLLRQVNDLLDMAKLEAGKMELHLVRMDLAPWFRRVSAQFEQAAEAGAGQPVIKRVQVHTGAGPDRGAA